MADKSKTSNKEDIRSKRLKKLKDASPSPKNSVKPTNKETNSRLSATPKESKENTPISGTPKSSRGNTPKPCSPKPKFQYDKSQLLKCRDSPLTKTIPLCLAKYRDVLPDIILDEIRPSLDVEVRDHATGDVSVIKFEDGIDPEGWYKHIHMPRDDSRGNSPLTLSAPPRPLNHRKERHPLDDSPLYKRKDASRDEEDGGGIVLGPQRKSFDTGCHVSALGKGDRSADRRRIGSGRIAMRHQDIVDSDTRNGGERRELPDLQSLRKQASQDRFYRASGDRYSSRQRDYERDEERDFGDQRSDYGRRRGGYRRFEEEPEWFSAGPTSQQDTIELRGFEEPSPRSNSVNKSRNSDTANTSTNGRREPEDALDTSAVPSTTETMEGDSREADGFMDELQDEEMGGRERGRAESCVSVADRNGSLETNESSSPDTSHEHANHTSGETPAGSGRIRHIQSPGMDSSSLAAQYDFNNILNMDNIPGLNLADTNGGPETAPASRGFSRFSQWFSQDTGPSAGLGGIGSGRMTPSGGGSRGPNSRNNSRRSSINEEFSYLNELWSGSKSPAVTSPILDDPLLRGASPSVIMDKRLAAHPSIAHLLQGLEKQHPGMPPQQQQIYHAQPRQYPPAAIKAMPQGALNASDVEAGLKSLLMAGVKHGNVTQQPNIPVLPSGGRILTAEELEASLTGTGNTPRNGSEKAASSVTSTSGRSLSNITSKPEVRSDPIDSLLSRARTNMPSNTSHNYMDTTNVVSSYMSVTSTASSLITPRPISKSNNLATQFPSQPTSSSSLPQPFLFQNTNSKDNSHAQSNGANLGQNTVTNTDIITGGHPPANRITTVAELEAAAMGRSANQNRGAEMVPTSDMAAFNRLLGMIKPQQTPQMVQRGASPQSVTAPTLNMQAMLHGQTPQNTPVVSSADKTMLQKLLQHQQAQQQQQLSLQEQATKQLQMKHLQQQQIQQQHQQMQQQHLQQQLKQLSSQGPSPQASQAPHAHSQATMRTPQQLGGMIRAVPTGKSPIPPPLNLQPPPPGGAHVTSPLLQPTSPRAPSPIMFGSQPPMHLTAPAPIHAANSPTAGSASATGAPANSIARSSPSPNTLQVAGGGVAQRRVPSPAELHSRAQVIMQNALIKKQLEGQKQRFLQKQQMVGRSPSPTLENKMAAGGAPVMTSAADQVRRSSMATPPSDHMTSTPAATKAGLNPAFTPTSVIRKMATNLHEEKAKHSDEGEPTTGAASKSAPVLQIVNDSSAQRSSANTTINTSTAESDKMQQLQSQFQSMMDQVKQGQQQQQQHQGSIPVAMTTTHNTSQAPGSAAKAPRPLVGQGSSVQNHVQAGVASGIMATPKPIIGVQHPQTPGQMSQQYGIPVSMHMASQHNAAQGGGRAIIKAAGQPMGMNALSPNSQQQRMAATSQPNNPHQAPYPPQTTPKASPPDQHLHHSPPGATPQQQQRPIMGNGGLGIQGSAGAGASGAMDSVRLAEHARQIHAQLQAGASPYMAMQLGRSNVPVPLVPMAMNAQQQHAAQQQQAMANALRMRAMMANPQSQQQGGNLHPSQLAALQAMQLNNSQHYGRQGNNPQRPQQQQHPATPVAMGGGAIQGRGIQGQGAQAQGGGAMGIFGRTASPTNHAFPPMQVGDGQATLAKLFGTDVLKQQYGSMPPLPNQTGQHIMTVEDLERRHQTVTN